MTKIFAENAPIEKDLQEVEELLAKKNMSFGISRNYGIFLTYNGKDYYIKDFDDPDRFCECIPRAFDRERILVNNPF